MITIKIRFFKLLPIFAFLNLLASCQSLSSSKNNQDKTKEIIEYQKSIVASSLDSGSPAKALKEVKELLRSHPKDPEVLTLMGLTQLALKNSSQAEIYFKKAYNINPTPAAALNLSSVYLDMQQYKKAQTLLQETVKDAESYDHRERLYHNLALTYQRSNPDEKSQKSAVLYFKKALEENPTFYMSHIELARIYKLQRKPSLAQSHFVEANASCPKCMEPLKELVGDHIKKGRKEEARELLIGFLRLDELKREDKKQAEELLRFVNQMPSSLSSKSANSNPTSLR